MVRPRRYGRRVLFQKRFWAGIADGSITVAFRRWKRLQVVADRPYRTPAGRIQITSIGEVDPSTISDADARRAGHTDSAALRDDMPGSERLVVYRIEFYLLDEPDPREVLAADDRLGDADIAEISARLDRLDRASRHGPWTRPVLRAIRDRPAVRAPDLATVLRRETKMFKMDVRKLKNLGLTISLRIGYRLSPRGEAYMRAPETKTPASEP